MISERQLSEDFDSFWQHFFPLLNPTFVRRFNAEKERVISRDGRSILPVPMGESVDRYDLVAELAFEMAQENFSARSGNTTNHKAAIRRAVATIGAITGIADVTMPSAAELDQATALLSVYGEFLSTIPMTERLVFRPHIKGVGILDAMEGDFCSTSTLFEVKAVNRNLLSSDIRQVLCYLVAGVASHEYSWTEYCIFNPRLAVVYTGKTGDLIAYISGRSPYDCIADVVDALMEREQPLEARF